MTNHYRSQSARGIVPVGRPELAFTWRREGTGRRIIHLATLTGLMAMMSCDGTSDGTSDGTKSEGNEIVTGHTSPLKNTGRTPEQTACDTKLQNCYIDCSVRYPDAPATLNEALREGCFDSCDASHNLCTPAKAAAVRASSLGVSSASALESVAQSPTISPPLVGAETQAAARTKACTATTDGGLWCCVRISTPPYLSCTYTPPPDTISAFTAATAKVSQRE